MHLEATSPELVEKLRQLITDRKPTRATADLGLPADHDTMLAIAHSGLWPPAVSPSLVIDQNDEQAKRIRATTVLADFVRLMPGKKFLDYGCGEGHAAVEAARRGCASIGYDPVPQGWDRHSVGQVRLTDDLQTVRDSGPYDIILCYDVLDHAKEGEPEVILKTLHSLLNPDGYVYLRCHPYTSSHGTHLYTSLNLAYAHLLLPPDDITALGGKPESVTRILKPLDTYRGWLATSGLRVNREIIRRLEPPQMFHDPAVVGRLISELYGSDDVYVKDLPALHSILSMEFIDYDLAQH